MTSSVRVVIVDDEPLARESLRLALAKSPDVEVVAECGDAASAVNAIETLAPDVAFLDVQMPGLDGFGILRRIDGVRPPAVVFVTAHASHAIHAFEANAVDYVLKPFTDRRLLEALDRATRRARLEDQTALVEQMAAVLAAYRDSGASEGGSTARPVERLLVRDGERVRFVRVETIEFIEAAGNRVVLHTTEGELGMRATLSGTLAALDPRRFVRIHRSTVVNVDCIVELHAMFSGDYVARLRRGQELKVSRVYSDALLSVR